MGASAITPEDLVGKRFGEHGQLEVVCYEGKENRRHIYKVVCRICEKDDEMFGDGLFKMNRDRVVVESLPCSCNKFYKRTEKQHYIEINRKCNTSNLKFHGWVNSIGQYSARKLKLECLRCCRKWGTTTLASFNGGYRCVKCAMKDAAKVEDSTIIDTFLATGKFEGWTFARSGRLTVNGSASYWKSNCPICSSDEYVKVGLCSGIFESFSGSLQNGMKPCRCSGAFNLTKEMREFQIENESRKRGLNYKFIKWTNCKNNVQSKFLIRCLDHNLEKETSIFNFINNRSALDCCISTGFRSNKMGFFYLLKVCDNSGEDVFTGYGITNTLESRLQRHTCNFKKLNYHVQDSYTCEMEGTKLKIMEKIIKRTFPVLKQDISGFVEEATYPQYYLDIIKFIDNFKKETYDYPYQHYSEHASN